MVCVFKFARARAGTQARDSELMIVTRTGTVAAFKLPTLEPGAVGGPLPLGWASLRRNAEFTVMVAATPGPVPGPPVGPCTVFRVPGPAPT